GGAVCGAGLTVVAAVHKIRFVIQHPEQARGLLAAQLAHRLRLRGDQEARVDAILRRHQQQFLEIRRDVHPKVEAELDGLEREVSAVLDPDQRERWEHMYSEVRRNWLPRMPATQSAAGDAT